MLRIHIFRPYIITMTCRQYTCFNSFPRLHIQYCPKTFMEKHHLQAHSRTHSGARPFRCLCEVTFADKSNLKRHILNCKRLEAIQAEDNRAYTQTRKQVHIKACDESYRSDGNNEKSFSRRQSTRKRKQTSAPQQARTSSSYYGDYDSGGSDDDGDRIEDCMSVVERQSREQRKKKQPASPCSTSSAAKSAAAPLLLSSSFSPSPLSSPLLALGRGMSPFFLPAPQTTVLFSSPSSLSSPPSPPVPPFLSEAAAVGAATLPHRLMALTVPEVSSSNQLFSSPHKRRKLAIQREFLTPPFNHQQYHPHQGLNTQSNDGGGLFWLDASQHTVISTSTYHANITQNNINQSQITSKATSHKAPPRRAPRRAASKGVRALIQKMQMDSLNHQKREEEAKQERERVLRRGYDTEASVEDDNDNCDNDVNIDANTNFAPIFTDGGADASAGTSIGTRYRTSTGFLSSLLKLL